MHYARVSGRVRLKEKWSLDTIDKERVLVHVPPENWRPSTELDLLLGDLPSTK